MSVETEERGLRSIHGYEAVKQRAVAGLSDIGELFSSDVGTLREAHPDLYEVHQATMGECIALYQLDEVAQDGLCDALIRETFNSRTHNRFSIGEVHISRAKAAATNLLMREDSHASFGIGNIKAFRIEHDIYDELPDDYKKQLHFDDHTQHVVSSDLARFLNPAYLGLAYERAAVLYSATYSARKSLIDAHVAENGYSDWQKRYVISVMMCCTDPVPAGKSVDEMPYDNAYRLLLNPGYARQHFEESKDAILARQELSDRFFAAN